MKINKFQGFVNIFFILGMVIASNNTLNAHCEIPCGIYHDSLRIELILEHIATIEKSMNQINDLSKDGEKDYNQLIRWINNKDEHASKIQNIVSQYFLHQRIKIKDPNDKESYSKYRNQLEELHKIVVYSMKSKQSTDLKYIDKLKSTVKRFVELYFHNHEH